MLTAWTGGEGSWLALGQGSQCDTDAGEVYLDSSPGKGSTLEKCKQACEDATGCQSISFFQSGWCSHFSTDCTNTKNVKKALSFRLDAGSTNDVPSGQWGLV